MRARPVRHTPALLLLGALLLVAGCGGSKSAPPPPTPTPISHLSTSGMDLPRLEFCWLVPDRAVQAALGGEAGDHTGYGNGDRPSEAGVPDDVLHELGCTWTRSGGWAARAWVFAQPVEAPLARRVVAAAGHESGCRTPAGPAFGAPSYTQVCAEKGGAQRVRHAGLFGQTWLTCEVAGPHGADADQIRRRADAWCVSVANALDTRS
jgi:hypothetical protein